MLYRMLKFTGERGHIPHHSKLLHYSAGKKPASGNITISNKEDMPKEINSANEVIQKDTAWCMLCNHHDAPNNLCQAGLSSMKLSVTLFLNLS